jgi:hypothetical protein
MNTDEHNTASFKNFVGYDEEEVKRTSTEDLLILRKTILAYLKKNSSRKRSVSFREVYSRIMDELERRKSASNSSQDAPRSRYVSCYKHVHMNGNSQEQVTPNLQNMYCKEDLLKMSNFQFGQNNYITNMTLNIPQIRRPLKVAKCSAESFQFLSKKTKRGPVNMPMFFSDANDEETVIQNERCEKTNSYENMFEATKQFFAKNKQPSSTNLPTPQKPICSKSMIVRVEELSTELSFNTPNLRKISNTSSKKCNREEQYHCSPNHQKDMDLWLSSQSIIPSIEENALLTESTPEIDGMINQHITNEFKSVYYFDMPQQIFYDLD